jgi:hypothetical protein
LAEEQARGELTAAVQLVEELERATRDGPAWHRLMPLPEVARICKAASQPGLIERFLQGPDALAARYQYSLATAQAVLAEAQGDLQKAARLYAIAADRWSNFGVVLEHGQALLGLGRCTAGLGQALARDRLLDAQDLQPARRSSAAGRDRWLAPPGHRQKLSIRCRLRSCLTGQECRDAFRDRYAQATHGSCQDRKKQPTG